MKDPMSDFIGICFIWKKPFALYKTIQSLFTILLICIILSYSQLLTAQTPDNSIKLITCGEGKTDSIAIQSALQFAIEQAFRLNISPKIEILNDKKIANKTINLSSGIIKEYDVLDSLKLPNGNWGVTLKVILFENKLYDFAKANGIAIEINNSKFSSQKKQNKLTEICEVKVVEKVAILLNAPLNTAFDYEIIDGKPTRFLLSKNLFIELNVNVTANNKMDNYIDYFINTLVAISLSNEEIKEYKKRNKSVFPVEIVYDGTKEKYYLRQKKSIEIVKLLAQKLNDILTRNLKVQSGDINYIWEGKGDVHQFVVNNSIYFLKSGENAVTFKWYEKKSPQQVDSLSYYIVEPLMPISQDIFTNTLSQSIMDKDNKRRNLSFGISLGLNTMYLNAFASLKTINDRIYKVDGSTLSPGFSIGLISDMRITKWLNLRFTPTLEFNDFKLNYSASDNSDKFSTSIQSIPFCLPLYLKLSLFHTKNYRPYFIGGGGLSINLEADKSKPIYLQQLDLYSEFGVGCEINFSHFRLSPELKFATGYNNLLPSQSEWLSPRDQIYSQALSKLTSRILTLSFNFE